MAEWPDLDELKLVLDADPDADGFDATLTSILASAIRKVKADTGAWDEDTSEVTDSLSRAALRMAELMAQRPESRTAGGLTSRAVMVLGQDPAYVAHLQGARQRFSIG